MTSKNERVLLFVWLVINLAIGLWIVHDYGMSTDEPYYYLYADDSLEAYNSFFGRLFEPAYGVENLRYYGPAFIIIVNLLIKILRWTPFDFWEIGIWHYAYFVTFQLTGLCLYGLAKRWFNRWTAWTILVLFITQPLLWGHAFINPKDIPFMFFFAFSVWAGYRMVDSLVDRATTSISLRGVLDVFCNRFRSIDPRQRRIFWFLLFVFGLGLALSRRLVFFVIERVVKIFYFAPPDSWAAKVMRSFAGNVSQIPVDNYITKAQKIYARFDMVMLALVFCMIAVYLITLLTNTSFRPGRKSLSRQIVLRAAGGFRQLADLTRKRFSLPKVSRFVRRTAKALITPKVVLAGVVLGLTTSVRVLGPLAGVIVVLYLFTHIRQKSFPFIVAYLLWAGATTYLTWPFLWLSPITNIFESLFVMSNFPWSGTALFNGKLYTAASLPVTYLPVLMNLQFTETFMVIWYVGFGFFIWQLFRKEVKVDLFLYVGLGFLLPFVGFLVFRPPLYENFRQLLFLLPAMVLFGAFFVDVLFSKIQHYWLRLAMIVLIILPGMISLVRLHPYQYIYYNSFIGGVEGAFRNFELDYWYTSLGELAAWANENVEEDATIVARVGHRLITHQIRSDITVMKIGGSTFDMKEEYDYAILTTRWSTDKYYPDAEIITFVERDGGILGVLKYIKGHKLE
jgi:hypothetical protein